MRRSTLADAAGCSAAPPGLLSSAYAELVGIEPEEAFKTLIVEHDLTLSSGA